MITGAQIAPTSGRRPVLGIVGKSLHTPKREKRENNELESGRRLYRMQRKAAGLLFDPAAPRYKQPFAVCHCHRGRLQENVHVYRQVDGSKARYAGLTSCGSVWHCAVCARPVVEARRRELQLGLQRARELGYEAFLMTLTHPHTADHDLVDQLARQSDARQRFKNCRTYKTVMARYGRLGSVCSLETTHGVNGWHPHTHDLVIARPGLLDDRLALDELRAAWIRILFKVGLGNAEKLDEMHKHAFDLQGGNFAAEYIAKFGREPVWGEADELTRSHSKIGGRKIGAGRHVTPFQLLAWACDGDDRAGALFVDYAKAFQGKRMLSWSPGLKKTLGVNEQTDEEIAADDAQRPEEAHCIALDGDDWRLVLERDARGELLFIAARNGADGVRAFLHELRHHRQRTHSGDSDCYVQKPWVPGPGWNDTTELKRKAVA